MYITIEDIQKNEVLSSIPFICTQYGVPFTFVEHNPDIQSLESGLYLIVGTDKEKVYDKRNNPANMILNELRDGYYFPTVKTYFLRDVYPVNFIHNLIIYCRLAEFVMNEFPRFEIKHPERIPFESVRRIAEHHRRTHSSYWSPAMRKEYMVHYREQMNVVQKREDGKGFLPAYSQFTFSRRFNPRAIAPVNYWSFLRRRKQKVSYNCLRYSSGGVSTAQLEKPDVKKLIKALKKYPSVIYHIDRRTFYNTSSRAEAERRRNNPSSTYVMEKSRKYPYKRISYSQADEMIIFRVYNEIVYGEQTTHTAEEIANSGEPYSGIIIPASESATFSYFNLFKSNNVSFALDVGYVNHPGHDLVPLLYFKKDEGMVRAIHERMIRDNVRSRMIEESRVKRKDWYEYELGRTPLIRNPRPR